MNILFEISDKDLIVFCLVLLVIVTFGVIIFSIFVKDNKEEEEEEPELTEEQIKAREELQRVFNQMSEDLENQTATPREIEDFEREQEENAIISYQELIKETENRNEPINTIEEETIDETEKKFKNSDIISPIFGIQKENNLNMPKESINEDRVTARHAYEKMQANYEEENNRDFLNSLKEFRKNL